jgi:hypothetical protein
VRGWGRNAREGAGCVCVCVDGCWRVWLLSVARAPEPSPPGPPPPAPPRQVHQGGRLGVPGQRPPHAGEPGRSRLALTGPQATGPLRLPRAPRMLGYVASSAPCAHRRAPQGWIPSLERKLEAAAESAHPGFRCFFSAEPINGAPQVGPGRGGWITPGARHAVAPLPTPMCHRSPPPAAPAGRPTHPLPLNPPSRPQAKIIPESILQNCIKVSNEPPSDMASNMRRALAAFSPELEARLSTPAKRTAFRSILFGLCFYHSLLLGRKKFGTGIGTGAAGRPAGAGCGPAALRNLSPVPLTWPADPLCRQASPVPPTWPLSPSSPPPTPRAPKQAPAAAWASAAATPSTWATSPRAATCCSTTWRPTTRSPGATCATCSGRCSTAGTSRCRRTGACARRTLRWVGAGAAGARLVGAERGRRRGRLQALLPGSRLRSRPRPPLSAHVTASPLPP